MRGLLDEVASHGFSGYLESKVAREIAEDPVEDLRRGWDLHVEFGLANPALYALMYGDSRPGGAPSAALEAREILRGLVQRVAEAGRLRVGVEEAADMIQAAGVGVVLALNAARGEARDLSLSERTRETILAGVTTDEIPDAASAQAGRDRVASRAVALKAVLPGASAGFTPSESALLSEWLDRLARDPA